MALFDRAYCKWVFLTVLALPLPAVPDNFDPVSDVVDVYDNLDPFSTKDQVSGSPTKNMHPMGTDANNVPCRFSSIGSPLSLLEAVERALCYNPQTRQAWAVVKDQAAQVGINQAAFLPTLNATAQGSYGKYKQAVKNAPPFFSRSNNTTMLSYSLNLSWTLFDFGLRSANLANARQLLTAALATQDATLQEVFMATVQSYYDLLNAQGALAANLDSEKSAQESYKAAEAKYNAGVGTLADKLQAQTTYAQATSNRVKADGALKNTHGTLAIAMGLDANTPLSVDTSSTELPDTDFVKSVDELIDVAKQEHPNLIAANAELQAAQAKVEVARAEGLPTVALVGAMTYNKQLGVAPGDTTTNNDNVGIQVNVPLFEGFGRSYKIQSAKAQAEQKEANLLNKEKQVSLDVWKSYQSLQTETENLKATDNLLQSATQSYRVAQGRYKAGVGTIIELLNAQSALADAKQQRIKALSGWRAARLKLATSLGNLGFWAI